MKKLLSNIITAIFCTSLLFMSSASANYILEQGPDSYPDLPSSHWAYDAVTFLTNKKVVVGYPDGLYRPDQNVTRAEFATMTLKALGLYEKETDEIFDYVDTDDHWASRNIQAASYYGLVKGYPGGYFYPDNNVTRIEALNVVLSALDPENISTEQAQHFLSNYKDYSEIPNWALIKAGQAQMLGLVYNTPGHETTLEPLRPATRGELARFIFNMTEAVKVIPSKKLQEAGIVPEQPKKPARPKKASNGYVLDNVYYDEDYAVIPEGTILPMVIDTCLNSKTTKEGETFTVRTPVNFVSREKYIVVPIGVQMEGRVHKVTRPHKFRNNGYMAITTTRMIDAKQYPELNLVASLGERNADMRVIRNDPYLTRIRYNFVKGQNMYIHRGQRVNFVLLEPVKIKLFNRDDI